MEAAVITAVGIDVSKSKSTVAVRRPGGDIRIVMEHTSTYWRPIALTLKEAFFCFRCQCDADPRF